jgi:hypothetical protein
MEKQNSFDPFLCLSWNELINPGKNPAINPDKNLQLNRAFNPKIHPEKHPKWRDNQWDLFKQLSFWDYRWDEQKKSCKDFLSTKMS